MDNATETVTARAFLASANTTALWILAALGAIFFMRAAKALLIPIALAVLISYAIEPVVAWLERHRVPRVAGAAFILLVILALLSGGAYALRDDAIQMVEALPRATQRAREVVLSRLGSGSEAIQEAIKQLGTSGTAGSGAADAAGPGGMATQVPGSLVQRGVGAIFTLAGNVVVIFFLIFFLLISGHHVRNRLVEIAGPDAQRRQATSTIIDERQPSRSAAQPTDAAAMARGAAIATRGMPERNVPSCADCHGPTDNARNPSYPVIAGQHPGYLALQLELLRERRRGGSPYVNLMHVFVDRLGPEAIRDVTLYYSALPQE